MRYRLPVPVVAGVVLAAMAGVPLAAPPSRAADPALVAAAKKEGQVVW